MGNSGILFLGRKVKMHESFKELTSGDELYSLAKEFLEKHVAECCWKRTQDKGENKVAYCNPKGCPEFKLSANQPSPRCPKTQYKILKVFSL